MTTKKTGLGRGLNALLEGVRESSERGSSGFPDQALISGISEITLHSISPGRFQPRRNFDKTELESLADSIRAQGVLQAILLRKTAEDRYEILAGERRFQAARLAGLEKIPAVIKEVTDETAMAIGLIENIQRQDLNPIEEAMAFERLSKEFGLTHAQVAENVGKSRSAVTNSLRLLSLSDEVKILLETGSLEAGHAKALLSLRAEEQLKLAKDIVKKGLSVRETEKWVAHIASGESEKDHRTPQYFVDPDLRRLQESLSEKLGARLQIIHGSKGNGKIIIQYNSLDELDGILDHIK